MTDHSPDIDAQSLLRLSEKVSRIARALAQVSLAAELPSGEAEPVPNSDGPEIPEYVVRWLIQARQKRMRYLPEGLFAEPAWDMLLDLLHAEITDRRVSVSSLCIASGVPATTSLRRIKRMVDRGVLVRHVDRLDGRRTFLELAPEVSAALRRYFVDVVRTHPDIGKFDTIQPTPANQNDV
jgi:DNA-binding MarR family transcriptional regulator